MNSVNLLQGAKILAAGLGVGYFANLAAHKVAKMRKVETKQYTSTVIKAVTAFAGIAAAFATARYLGVISFKNFSFQSKTPEAAVPAAAVAAKALDQQAPAQAVETPVVPQAEVEAPVVPQAEVEAPVVPQAEVEAPVVPQAEVEAPVAPQAEVEALVAPQAETLDVKDSK